MRRGALFLPVLLLGCTERVELERKLSSFEVKLLTPRGSPERPCLLPGTPTTGVDLTGCPVYRTDALGRTSLVVELEARAVDQFGETLETFDGLAGTRVVPGRVEAAFTRLRFQDGVAAGQDGARPTVAFRGSFGQTRVWIVDDNAPALGADVLVGMNQACSATSENVCAPFSLTCVNTKPAVGFDPKGLAYCTKGCASDGDCPSGYFCTTEITAYADRGTDVSSGACVRRQPSYSAGASDAIHLIEPNLADVSRSDTLLSSPFQEEFVEIRRGKLVVTGIRIDGFYLTDLCPMLPDDAPPDADCTVEDIQRPAEFNHLFVFSFSRPDELFTGDKLIYVSGPMTEFNGLTEMAFPLWEVDVAQSPHPIPPPIDLHDPIVKHFPKLVEPGGRCFENSGDPEKLTLLRCDHALERLEGARIQLTVLDTLPIAPGSREENSLERFGQWPFEVDDGKMVRRFLGVTRENLPFYDPKAGSGRDIQQTMVGHLRQVAFDERSEPLWIVEPRDQADCPWCTNP